jgi:hypothetical protein
MLRLIEMRPQVPAEETMAEGEREERLPLKIPAAAFLKALRSRHYSALTGRCATAYRENHREVPGTDDKARQPQFNSSYQAAHPLGTGIDINTM